MKIYAACDYYYAYQHMFPFVKSAITNGNSVIFEIFPSMEIDRLSSIPFVVEQISALRNLPEVISNPKILDIRIVDHKLFLDLVTSLNIKDYKAFFASYRFLNLPRLIEELPFVVLDVDSIVNRKLDIPEEYDIGLFLRESNDIGSNVYEQEGMKVAAGALYLTDRAKSFIKHVHDNLLNAEFKWFCDQHGIFQAYNKIKDNLNVLDFSKSNPPFLDWQFDNQDAYVFTGKGDRKYSDQKYLQLKKRWNYE